MGKITIIKDTDFAAVDSNAINSTEAQFVDGHYHYETRQFRTGYKRTNYIVIGEKTNIILVAIKGNYTGISNVAYFGSNKTNIGGFNITTDITVPQSVTNIPKNCKYVIISSYLYGSITTPVAYIKNYAGVEEVTT